ncbi:MAG: hypothetical protein Q4D64_12690 [Prevotellaceae bacterium]|nr:hypothetical protein [Prevotellaceae bacterium]
MATVDLSSLLKGRVGELVFRTYRGKLIAQSRPTQYHDRNSEAQQKQRGGMRNLIAMYKCMRNDIRDCFEEATGKQRPYNRFIHHNIKMQTPVLSKKDYDFHRLIPLPYIISNGTLPPLDTTIDGNIIRFTINYKDWERDDIIRFIEFTTESIDGSPTDKYSCRHDDVIITHPTGQVIERELTHTGLYAFVHIRLFGGIRKISTQSLIPYSATPLP